MLSKTNDYGNAYNYVKLILFGQTPKVVQRNNILFFVCLLSFNHLKYTFLINNVANILAC